MKILINNQEYSTKSEHLNVADLLKEREVNTQGTAIAINDMFVPRDQWEVRFLKEGDRVTVISAAFGG